MRAKTDAGEAEEKKGKKKATVRVAGKGKTTSENGSAVSQGNSQVEKRARVEDTRNISTLDTTNPLLAGKAVNSQDV